MSFNRGGAHLGASHCRMMMVFVEIRHVGD